jgi:hypothetical protein
MEDAATHPPYFGGRVNMIKQLPAENKGSYSTHSFGMKIARYIFVRESGDAAYATALCESSVNGPP